MSTDAHALPPPEGVPPAPQESFKTLTGAYFLGYVPRVVTLVCVDRNPLAVAWHMPVNKDPFLYAVSIAKENHTHSLIVQAKDFTVNFLDNKFLPDVLIAGRHHGSDVDKWKLMATITPKKALKVDAFLVEQALMVYECVFERIIEFTDHSLVIGRVELIHYRKGKLKAEKVKYPLHMGRNYFSRNSKAYIYKG